MMYKMLMVAACLLISSPMTTAFGEERIQVAQAATDDSAWELVKDSADPRVLEKFLAQYPGSSHAQEAREKLAALNDDGESLSAPQTQQSDTSSAPNLAAEVQRELKRVGCYSGKIDGNWGGGSRNALKRFADSAGVALGSQPTARVLGQVSSARAGTCKSSKQESGDSGTQTGPGGITGSWSSLMTCANRTVRGAYTFTSADRSGVIGSFSRSNSRNVDATISGGGVSGKTVKFMVTFYILGKRNDEDWVGRLSDDGRTITGQAVGFWTDDCRFVLSR